jgi:ubiquinone/menaquinone biosynthesis C-methylase UbiE
VRVPERFDAVFLTLMLHHRVEPKKVFESLERILAPNGTAVVLDLCEHNFEEFRTELADMHLGFKLDQIKGLAEEEFSNVQVAKIPGISCSNSGRSAEIFVVSMKKFA